MKMKTLYNVLLCLGLIIIFVALDQITKIIVLNRKDTFTGSVTAIDGFLGITYHENTGAAWGIFTGKKVFLFIITFIALGIFGYMMKNFDLKKYPFYSVSLVLMVSGTIGNFIDRLLKTGVIDFIKTLFMDFPIFNFADMCLTCGVVCMMIDLIFGQSGELWKK